MAHCAVQLWAEWRVSLLHCHWANLSQTTTHSVNATTQNRNSVLKKQFERERERHTHTHTHTHREERRGRGEGDIESSKRDCTRCGGV